MASFSSSFVLSQNLFFFSLFCFFLLASADLSATFYASSCPEALSTIQTAVKAAVAKEKRMGASLLRLHFHDCFVNGCDASILLDDTSSFTGEKTATPNAGSLRGYEVIDTIKSQVESVCPNVVSCADIIAVAARDSVVAGRNQDQRLDASGKNMQHFKEYAYYTRTCTRTHLIMDTRLGGPSWTVQLGRRDSTTASLSAANSDIPGPTLSLSDLISAFSKKGLNAKEMVALSGAHTIGQASCATFRTRIYNDTNIDLDFATSLQSKCRSTGSDDNLSPLDKTSPTYFDVSYYRNLIINEGLLHSDQELFNGGSTDSQVEKYCSSSATFFTDFSNAMVKMGNISPLTGYNGEIRTKCRKTNS